MALASEAMASEAMASEAMVVEDIAVREKVGEEVLLALHKKGRNLIRLTSD